MNAYRAVWTTVWGVLALVGAGATLVLSPGALVFLFVTFAVSGALMTPAVVSDYVQRPLRERRRLTTTGAMVGGTTVSAFVGHAVVLGAGVFALCLLALASSPPAVSAYGRWLRAAPTPSQAQLDAMARGLAYASPDYVPIQPIPELRLLTDEQLCRRWRSSYVALQSAVSAARMMRTVEERQRCLDELERRNATGLAAWLASGARAAGNPLPYISEDCSCRPAINWDELLRGQGL
jgi:hypothetical protein